MKAEKVKIVSDIIRTWVPWVLLIVGLVIAFLKVKEYKNKPAETITVEREVRVEVLSPIRWRDKIKWKETAPETVFVDTGKTPIEKISYERPWGILSVDKQDRELRVVTFRPSVEDPNDIFLSEYVWSLRTGKGFKIYPTKNPANPFKLRENRDLIGFRFGGGYSALDKVYLMSGIYLKGMTIKCFRGDIGLCSYVSFSRQDIRLEFMFR